MILCDGFPDTVVTVYTLAVLCWQVPCVGALVAIGSGKRLVEISRMTV